jgi:glycosyltransferase involved in cell wall biosynthesis
MNTPVDCLMVTLASPERFPHAVRSIEDFCNQSYCRKRLFIITNGGTARDTRRLVDHVESLGRDDIHIALLDDGLNLGQLRNASLDLATSDIICQWDDDDRFHPLRLETQAAYLEGHNLEVVYLQDVMQYFPQESRLYWTNWRATPDGGHPGTLMARRLGHVRYPTAPGQASHGEDSILAQLLIKRGGVGYISGQAHLFIYVSHGGNSWHDGHHLMLRSELSISTALLKRREPMIREGMAALDLGRAPIDVCSIAGTVFTLG